MLRSGRLSLGPTIERFEELIAERTADAPRGRAVERDGGAPPARADRRRRAGRRGDHVAVLVRRVGELLRPRRRDAGVRRRRSADAQPRPGAVEAAVTERTKAIVAVDIFGYPCELDELRAIAERARARAGRRRVRGARRRVQGRAGRLARPERGLRVLPEQADGDRRGRRRHDALRGRGEAPAQPPQPGARTRTAAGSTIATSGSTTAGPTSRRRSASASSRSSTRSSSCAPPRRRGTTTCSRRSTACGRRAGRRRPRPLVVRLRRQARRGHRPRARHRALGERRHRVHGEYLPCIHLQPYMRERFGFGEGSARSRRTRAGGRSRCRSSPQHRAGGPGARRRRRADLDRQLVRASSASTLACVRTQGMNFVRQRGGVDPRARAATLLLPRARTKAFGARRKAAAIIAP